MQKYLSAFSNEELNYYEYLLNQADPILKGLKQVGSRDCVAFFKTSLLPNEQLKLVWEICSSFGTHLDQAEFYVACKLIALAQAGYDMVLENLQLAVPLPKFQGVRAPVNQAISVQRSQYDMTMDQWSKYDQYFQNVVQNGSNFISGTLAKQLFVKTQLSRENLSQIWQMADVDSKGYLLKGEFIVALHLIGLAKKNVPLPSEMPDNLLPVLRGEPPQIVTPNNMSRIGSNQNIQIQPRLGSNQSIQVPRRLMSNSNIQPVQGMNSSQIMQPPPQRLGSNASIQFQNNLNGGHPLQNNVPVNPNEIPGWDPLQQQMNMARQQLGTVQSQSNNMQLQLKELFDRILIEKQQEISSIQQITNSYRQLLQALQEQHNSFQVELAKLETMRQSEVTQLSQVTQQVHNQQMQNQQLQQQFLQNQQYPQNNQYQQQHDPYPMGNHQQQTQPQQQAQQLNTRNSWEDIRAPAQDINMLTTQAHQQGPDPSAFATYYPPQPQINPFFPDQDGTGPKGVLKQNPQTSQQFAQPGYQDPQIKKQVHFNEPSKHDVTLGQIEVDLNKEFKPDDWNHEENAFGNNNTWNNWGGNPGTQAQLPAPQSQAEKLPW